jgi:uncharacterized cupin superfamily protein
LENVDILDDETDGFLGPSSIQPAGEEKQKEADVIGAEAQRDHGHRISQETEQYRRILHLGKDTATKAARLDGICFDHIMYKHEKIANSLAT